MLKTLLDRLAYALIGFLFGAVLGAALWWLYDAGFSLRFDAPHIDATLSQWVRWTGGIFALLGLLLGARAGDVAGVTVREVYDHEADRGWHLELPGWLLAIVVLGVGLVILRQQGLI